MSLEVFGDEGEVFDLPEDCWSAEQVKDLQGAVQRLFSEGVYEGGKKENGIAVRFIARMNALKFYAELAPMGDVFVDEAKGILGEDF